MFEMHADKGTEDWEIYAECVREAMSRASGLKLSDQKLREQKQYEEFLAFQRDEVEVEGKVIYSIDEVSKSKVSSIDPQNKNLTEPLINN